MGMAIALTARRGFLVLRSPGPVCTKLRRRMRYNWMPMESFLTSAGYGAHILFGFLEACCIPISSEITFGFAGVWPSRGT